MNTAFYLLIAVYMLIIVYVSFRYICKRYDIKSGYKDLIINHKTLFLVSLVSIGILIVVNIILLRRASFPIIISIIKWSTLCWGVYVAAVIDYREKRIPNEIVVSMSIIRILLLVLEVVINIENWTGVVLYMLIGAGIGGFVILIPMLLSRNGIGMGDLKLMLVVGSYVGGLQILSTMFNIFFASAIISVGLLVAKKVKVRDTLPLAPFIYFGVAVEYIASVIGSAK